MNASTSSTEISTSANASERQIRYFVVTYFNGNLAIPEIFTRTFRSRKMQRAKRIAMSFMPRDADHMEIVEINGHEFQQRRAARRPTSGNRDRVLR